MIKNKLRKYTKDLIWQNVNICYPVSDIKKIEFKLWKRVKIGVINK